MHTVLLLEMCSHGNTPVFYYDFLCKKKQIKRKRKQDKPNKKSKTKKKSVFGNVSSRKTHCTTPDQEKKGQRTGPQNKKIKK
jgi:hypothetical protein